MKQKSPCIIFIDELDGFDSSAGIILLSATNRPEIFDPALLRSGRFDRQVLVDKPDKQGRLAILKLHSKNKKLIKNVDLEKIAALTPGFTGADLENLVNEASLIAVREGGEYLKSILPRLLKELSRVLRKRIV